MVNWSFIPYLIMAILLSIILVAVVDMLILDNHKCNRWGYTNHCDALCGARYGNDKLINAYHNDSTVIPLDKNYNNYICICSDGNITTSWTCM